MKKILMSFALLLTGCVGLPENVKPVDHFNSDRYLTKSKGSASHLFFDR